MPKSKRSKLVTLSQTDKKGRENKEKLFDDVRANLDKYRYVWVFQLDNARTPFLQEIRNDWKGSKIVLGKRKVLEKALGTSPENEYRDNIHQLSAWAEGSIGLLFTDEDSETVKAYFIAFARTDYARAKSTSPISFTVPAGIVYSTGGQIPAEDDVPMTHSVEENLRNQLKMPTKMKNGKIVLDQEYAVCQKGDVLDVRQALILKRFGVACSEFKVKVIGSYDSETTTALKL